MNDSSWIIHWVSIIFTSFIFLSPNLPYFSLTVNLFVNLYLCPYFKTRPCFTRSYSTLYFLLISLSCKLSFFGIRFYSNLSLPFSFINFSSSLLPFLFIFLYRVNFSLKFLSFLSNSFCFFYFLFSFLTSPYLFQRFFFCLFLSFLILIYFAFIPSFFSWDLAVGFFS